MLESIERHYQAATVKSVALGAVGFLPYLTGFVVGFVIRSVLWLISAIVAGYEHGRG